MEELKHECGVAMIRLRKPLAYYEQKYGTSGYATNKLYLLMQKQYNRGQEGAGAAVVSLESKPGEEFLFRERKEGKNAIHDVFSEIVAQQQKAKGEDTRVLPFSGECYMGHLRYSTTGRSGVTYVHPHLRRSNYRHRTLAFCGNFNLTNIESLLSSLEEQGQHPRRTSDTTVVLEQLGYWLDETNGDTRAVLKECVPTWDGGFVLCGMTGSGEMFAVRDPWGIRTGFWYADEEVVVVASERPAIQTIMNVQIEDIHELSPGEALFINSAGETALETIHTVEADPTPCSFERIYFSRGNDRDIYQERKQLGRALIPQILEAIDGDLDNTVFSFIPNTAEVAYMGMLEGLNDRLDAEKVAALAALGANDFSTIQSIVSRKIRTEKIAIKDIKLRTFISESGSRGELANHVYDITYGTIRPEVDNLVILDDSIVRGTTLKRSILTILSRLKPRKMVIVSSAPQIRFPDFYGIDMSEMKELIAYRAAHSLCEEAGIQAKTVQDLYTPFSDEEISQRIVDLVKPKDVACPIEIIFQKRETLRAICSTHIGDWYFSGNFPTPGGRKLLAEKDF